MYTSGLGVATTCSTSSLLVANTNSLPTRLRAYCQECPESWGGGGGGDDHEVPQADEVGLLHPEVAPVDGDDPGGEEDGGPREGTPGDHGHLLVLLVTAYHLFHCLEEERVSLGVHMDAVGVVGEEDGGEENLQIPGLRRHGEDVEKVHLASV